MGQYILVGYILIINMLTFIVFVVDKKRAVKNRWRISEKTLMTMTVIGGSFGALLSMSMFRHKTRKPLFKYGVPLVMIVELVIMYKLYIHLT